MEVKLGGHGLLHSQYTYTPEKGSAFVGVRMHTRVCPTNGLRSLGIVTDMDPSVKQLNTYSKTTYIEKVTVLWLYGPNKGKSQVKKCEDLINYDDYRASIMEGVARLDRIEAEAAEFGK